MVVAVVGVSAVASPVIGQDDHPAAAEPTAAAVPEQPTASAIIERFIEVTGGRAAWESLQSLRGLGSLEIVGANVGGSLAIFQTREGFRMSVDAGPAGAQVTIRRGDEAWQVRPDGTTTVVTGGALRKLLRDRSFNPLIDAATLYTRMELVGVEDVNGEPAWKIRCIPADAEAAEELRFFGVASGLQVKVIEQGAGQAAAFPTEIFLTDYRQVGPVKVAFGTTISFARSGVQITLEAMQANVAISECLFAPPAGPVAVPEAKQESPKETLKAFMAVDLEAMNTPEVVHWLSRLDAAKRAIDPSDPDADATRKALSQFHRMCIEKVRGGAAASP
jgi:hypothetical protein